MLINNYFFLISKMKNGNEAAMNLFVEKYYDKVLSYCRYHCYDRWAAVDLAQETFTRFFSSLAGFRPMGKSINYLYVIARNVCIDHSKKIVEVSTDALPELTKNCTDEINQRLDIQNALDRLPDELREIIILRYFQELTIPEAAAVLGIGVPLAKYRIRRAKEQLLTLLGEEETT